MLVVNFTPWREPDEVAHFVTARAVISSQAVFKKALVASYVADALRLDCAGMIVMPSCEEDVAICARLCPRDWRFFLLERSGENVYRLTEI